MNPLETLNVLTIRRELMDVCRRMQRIAKTGSDAYNIEDPEYKKLAQIRDRLGLQLNREFNRRDRNDSDRKTPRMAQVR